jgi:hypothetical protein
MIWYICAHPGTAIDTTFRPDLHHKKIVQAMSNFYWTDQRRPTAYQALERPSKRSYPNHYHGFVRDDYRPSSEYQHTHPNQGRDAVAYDPAIRGQYTQAYFTQTSSARPMNAHYRPHVEIHDFDYQQYSPRHIDDSETSSTAAVVGSQAPQSFLAQPPVYHDPYTTAQTGDPYTQPARVQHQQEPLMNHNVTHGWTNRPAPGPYHGPSYQHGGHIQHAMNPNTPYMPSPGPMPTPYHRPQAWSSLPEPTFVPPPAMQAPSFAFIPPTYIQNVPAQAPNVNALYPAGYQSYAQPPANVSSSNLPNNAVDQSQDPRVNNDNTVNPRSIAPGATRPSKKSRRGNGRGNGKGGAQGSSGT